MAVAVAVAAARLLALEAAGRALAAPVGRALQEGRAAPAPRRGGRRRGTRRRASPARVQGAAAAWDKGQGEWPRMSLANRIEAIERLVLELRKAREQMVAVLEWGALHTGALEPQASSG